MHALETERLSLRWLDEADAPFIMELVNDPDWLRFIGDRGVHDEAAARDYILNGPVSMYAQHGHGLYGVALKATGELVGICGLIRRDTLEDVDIGFAFLPQHRGRGYAREAARATLEYGRSAFGLQRIVAIVAPDNAASLRLLDQLGLKLERTVRLDGEVSDVCLLAWRATA